MTSTLTTPRAQQTRRPSSARPRVKTSWLLAALAMFLVVVLLVMWAVSNASDRTQVLAMTEPVAAGEAIPDSAIGSVSISSDAGFGRIYLESQRDLLVGAVAVADLVPGDILGPSMVTGEPEVIEGEQLVGVVLRAGRYPSEIERGDGGFAVSTLERGAGDPASVPVRVVSVSISETLEASVTLAVADADAARVGTWAGLDELVMVVTPLGVGE